MCGYVCVSSSTHQARRPTKSLSIRVDWRSTIVRSTDRRKPRKKSPTLPLSTQKITHKVTAMDCPHLETGIRITRNWLTTQLLQLPTNGDLLPKRKQSLPANEGLLTSSKQSKTVASAPSSSSECEQQQWRCSGKHLIYSTTKFHTFHLVNAFGGRIDPLSGRCIIIILPIRLHIRSSNSFDIPQSITHTHSLYIHYQPQVSSSSR